MSKEDSPPSEKRGRLETHERLTETAKDGTAWREEQVGRPLHHSPIEGHVTDGEPTALARRKVTSRLQSFFCFITLEMLRTIQEWTVQHALQTQHENWFMAIPELMAFIAILLLWGIVRLPSLHDAWSAKLGPPLINRIMARNRFKDIIQHLRFDDKDTRGERVATDRFAAISDVWGSFVANRITSYNPGRHITIDEQLFPTKTRCCFLQYIATKPDKFGIKFCVACDLKSKYVCKIIPYLGKDPSRPPGERLSENVVMKLMEPFMDKGRTVTIDNFFTSLSLARRLHSRKTTLLGTVNKIRRELPDSAKKNLAREEFSTEVFSTSGATLTVYVPKRKKTVCLLSSVHSVVETEATRKKKPNTVTDYNSMKCGVDVMAQMVRKYTVRSGTRRWPVAVFYNMIDIAALNAHVLYQACTGVKERRVDFLLELANELAQSHMAAKEVNEQNLQQQPPTPDVGKRALCQVKCCCRKNRATKRCMYCDKFACGKCIKEVSLNLRCTYFRVGRLLRVKPLEHVGELPVAAVADVLLQVHAAWPDQCWV
uniref:PiggyBac transposable element-derived protein domain-containing protein n=1 Tax=Gouania willdenowi TaxID=441366 RepID=A0A8C5HDC0_GOUWI